MTSKELAEKITEHANAIRDIYVEYLKQFPSDRVLSEFQKDNNHLSMTIWDNHFSTIGILGHYMIDGESKMVYAIDYDSRYGHSRSNCTKHLEDIANIDDLEPATEFKGDPVVK